MRAVLVERYGGPEVLLVRDVPDPQPGPRQILVELAAAGINFVEIYHRRGVYETPTPFTLGGEGAGRVLALGAEVDGIREGDLVASVDLVGSYAEKALVDSDRAVRVPDGISAETAAAVLLQGMTAHYLTRSTYPVSSDDTVLIHAAAGGLGLLLTQVVKLSGGRVIGTVSTEEKERIARAAGADKIIRYRDVDFVGEIRRLTNGEGVAVVYDGVGGTTFEGSLASLRRRGMLVVVGQAAGPVPPVDVDELRRRGSLFLTRPTLRDYISTPNELQMRAAAVFEWVLAGKVEVRIGSRYSLEDAAQAHDALEARKTMGKVLLEVR